MPCRIRAGFGSLTAGSAHQCSLARPLRTVVSNALVALLLPLVCASCHILRSATTSGTHTHRTDRSLPIGHKSFQSHSQLLQFKLIGFRNIFYNRISTNYLLQYKHWMKAKIINSNCIRVLDVFRKLEFLAYQNKLRSLGTKQMK